MEGTADEKRLPILISAFLLGLLYNLLFFSKTLGVSYPIYLAAFYFAFFFCMKGRPLYKPASILLLPIFSLSFNYLFFSNEVFNVLDFLAVPILVVIHTTLAAGCNTYRWSSPLFIADICFGFFIRTLGSIGKPFRLIKGLFPDKQEDRKPSNLKRVLTGVVVAVPIVLILASLLASADAVFGRAMESIPDFFDSLNAEEFIARVILVIIIFIFTAGYLASLNQGRKPEKSIPESTFENIPKRLEPVMASTVLVIINLLYMAFVLIQFTYLFGGYSKGLPDGMTYSGYARRGFFELIAVAVINFGILLISIGFTRADSDRMKTFSAILQSILVGCTGIMLVSAWFRMSLYEEAYGFTYLRVLTQAFMVFLLILAAVMVVKIWRTEISFFKPFVAIALASFILVNYINIDLIIVRSNIKRFNETGKIDVAYIGNLSYDAVPELVDLLESLNGESRLKALRILRDKKMYISGLNSWQSFNVSRAKAGMHLGRLQMEEAFKTLELWEKEQSGSNMGTDRAQEPYETWTD